MLYKGISVVIPNYNGIKLLPVVLPCLIAALDNTGEVYEIIISDDCSTDESVNYIKESYPRIIVLECTKNEGFSPTINKGIFAAKHDYLLLLNSDVKLTPTYFENLFRYFEKEDTFGVMGRIVGWDDDKIQDAAKFPRLQGLKIKTAGNYYLNNPQKNDWVYSTYLSGANAFLDRKKVVQIGGFDELFAPFYVEDFELSLRAWRLGWKCYYDHFSVCQHQVSISIKSKNKKYFINKIYYRNKMFLQYIHLQGLQVYKWFLQLIPETLFYVITGRFYFAESLVLFLKNKTKASASKTQLAKLVKPGQKLLTVQEVFNYILKSINDKNITKF
jgi:GT2 family glycosyltransferase